MDDTRWELLYHTSQLIGQPRLAKSTHFCPCHRTSLQFVDLAGFRRMQTSQSICSWNLYFPSLQLRPPRLVAPLQQLCVARGDIERSSLEPQGRIALAVSNRSVQNAAEETAPRSRTHTPQPAE